MKAREFIYQSGNTVDGAKVDDALGEGSWVPVLVTLFFFIAVLITHSLWA
jgi:hypothetical protein